MIEIADIRVKDISNKSRLCCDLIVDKEKHNIWFEFDSQYKQYICTERIDGILVNILLYCMENGHDITSNIPVSEKLYYQLINFLIPTIADNIEEYNEIKINVPIDSVPIKSENAVGTGCSGGVDSFYTILKNVNKPTKSFNITHLTFFNAGASGNFGGDEARKLFHKRLELMKKTAEELKLPLIAVDTNINEFLHQMHICTHTFRSLAIPLLFQKLFSVYYYSSGYGFNNVHFDYMSVAGYDLLNCMCLSNENITYYSVGGETDRISKISYISDFEIVKKRLDVCIKEEDNCGECSKCKRTILALYALNKLNDFEDIFPLEKFRKKKNRWLSEVLDHKKNDIYMQEIYDCLKKNKIKIPLSSRTVFRLYNFAIGVLRNIYHLFRKR